MQLNNLQRVVKLLNSGLFCLCAVAPWEIATAAEKQQEMSLQEITEREILRARLSVEERTRRATEHVRLGEEYLRTRQYNAAAEQFTLALSLQPEMERARLGQAEALRYMETRTGIEGNTAVKVLEMSRVRDEYNQVEVNQYMAQAALAYKKGVRDISGLDIEQKAVMLDSQLQSLDEAEGFAERAALRLEGMPVDENVASRKIEIVTLKADIKRKRAEYLTLLEQLRREKATGDIAREKKMVGEMEESRRNNMLAQTRRYMDKLDYELAEEIVKEMLRINPADSEARDLQLKIQNAKLNRREAVIRDLQKENRAHMMLKLEKDTISDVSFSRPIRYPADWDVMNKRKTITREEEMVTARKQETRRKLEEAYSFDFMDAPLVEVVLENIRQRTGLNINPAGIPEDKAAKEINLTPRNMRLENIFKHILRQLNAEDPNAPENVTYQINDAGIINFTTVGTLEEVKKISTRVFDIKDIAAAVDSARKMPTSFGDDDDDDDDEEDDGGEQVNVKDVICQALPNDFSDEKGNIDYNDAVKKLTVKGTPEQIGKVVELLGRLRAVQNIQVSVTARFLKLRDDFWEQFKSEFYDFNNYNSSSDSNNHSKITAPMSIIGGTTANASNNNNGYTYNTYLSSQGNNPGFNPGVYWNEITGSMFNGTFSGLSNVFGHGKISNVDKEGLSFAIQQKGFLGDLQSQWFVQMVRKNERTDELFSPHVVVYNNRYGWIRFAMRVPYIENYVSGSGEYGLQAQLGFLDDGCSLEVEPCVSADKKYITIRAQPKIREIIDMAPTEFGIVGTENLYTLDLPRMSIYDARTYATVPDGGAVISSGMSTNVNGRGRNGTPVLQDLPIIGNVFSNRYTQKNKESYTCLISAKMILLDEEEAVQTGSN